MPLPLLAAAGLILPAAYLGAQVNVPLDRIAFLQAAFFLLPAYLLLSRYGWHDAFETRKLGSKMLAVLIASAALTVALNMFLTLWVELVPASKRYEEKLNDLLSPGHPYGLLLDVLRVALIPAVCEEFFFRGFLLLSLRSHMSARFAVIASAALFALYHLHPSFLPFYFFLGLYFAILFLRGRNLLLSILAHFVNNGLGILLYHLSKTPA